MNEAVSAIISVFFFRVFFALVLFCPNEKLLQKLIRIWILRIYEEFDIGSEASQVNLHYRPLMNRVILLISISIKILIPSTLMVIRLKSTLDYRSQVH